MVTEKQEVAIFVAAIFGVLFWVTATLSMLPAQQPPPYGLVCEEDEVIVGRGDYVPDRGWDTYQCEALDDIVP